jgi:chemotaxis protein MotD
MSAVALNPSFGPLLSSPDPMRDPGRQPSGAFSFSSILKGIDQQDAPANGGGSPGGVAESAENTANQDGTANEPMPARNPFSLQAGLAALGYGPLDATQGSATSVPTQNAVAPTQSGAGPPSTINSGIAAPAATAATASPASRAVAPSSPASTSNPPSIEADLAALGYGPLEASPDAPSQTAVSQRPASQRAAAQTPPVLVSPKSQATLPSRSNPGLAAPTPAPASSFGTTGLTAGQNDAAGAVTTTSDPTIGATLPALGSGASPSVVPLAVSPGSGAGVQTQNRAASAPQRQVATTGRAAAMPPALSAGSASQGASTNVQAQTGGGPQSAVTPSARTRPGPAAPVPAATDPAQAAPASSAAGPTVVPQGAVFQAQGSVPQSAVSQVAVSQVATSQVATSQVATSQTAAAPDLVSSAPVSASSTSGRASNGAAAPQNPFGAAPRIDPNLAGFSSLSDAGSPVVANVEDAVSNATIANPLTADPSLGLQSLQSRTHLAMTNALPVRASAPERRATPSSSAPVGASAAASQTSPETTAQPGDAEPAQQRVAASASISPIDADASGSTSSSAAAPIAVAGLGIDPSSSGLASVPLSQLADFVADQASALRSSPSSPSAPSASAAAPQAVKELEISLDPANLGAVSVKMRLANGKLSIVIGVSNSSTLAAIENERGAIAARLGSTEQPLENLVIVSREPSSETAQDFAQTTSWGNDASDQGSPGQARSNNSFSGAQRGESGSARGPNDPPASSGSTETGSSGGTGALLV